MPLQRQFHRQFGIVRLLLHGLLQLLNFRRIGGLTRQFDLRGQTLPAAIAILQWDLIEQPFGIIHFIQNDIGFRQQQRNVTGIARELQRLFQHWYRFLMLAFTQQLDGLLQFQLILLR